MVTATKVKKIAPQRLKMSYEEYLEFAGDSEIVEWVNEEVIQYMPPIPEHQNISRFLIVLLDAFIEFFELAVVPVEQFIRRQSKGRT